jgi:hypothetical protein
MLLAMSIGKDNNFSIETQLLSGLKLVSVHIIKALFTQLRKQAILVNATVNGDLKI